MFVVFDLDGTLADNSHRNHLIDGSSGKKDWDAYFDACHLDAPIIPMVETIQALLAAGHHVHIWTGRSETVRDKTEAWLSEHLCSPNYLWMRRVGDYRPDTELKEFWMEQHGQPDLVFEDRKSVVDMWRRNGVQCCQVALGDF